MYADKYTYIKIAHLRIKSFIIVEIKEVCFHIVEKNLEEKRIQNLKIRCSRKNFKLLFSAGIILTVGVSILYFRPMRMAYAILLG